METLEGTVAGRVNICDGILLTWHLGGTVAKETDLATHLRQGLIL